MVLFTSLLLPVPPHSLWEQSSGNFPQSSTLLSRSRAGTLLSWPQWPSDGQGVLVSWASFLPEGAWFCSRGCARVVRDVGWIDKGHSVAGGPAHPYCNTGPSSTVWFCTCLLYQLRPSWSAPWGPCGAPHVVDLRSVDIVSHLGMCSLPGTGKGHKDESKRSCPQLIAPVGETKRLAAWALTWGQKPPGGAYSENSTHNSAWRVGRLQQRGNKLNHLLNENTNKWEMRV